MKRFTIQRLPPAFFTGAFPRCQTHPKAVSRCACHRSPRRFANSGAGFSNLVTLVPSEKRQRTAAVQDAKRNPAAQCRRLGIFNNLMLRVEVTAGARIGGRNVLGISQNKRFRPPRPQMVPWARLPALPFLLSDPPPSGASVEVPGLWPTSLWGAGEYPRCHL